ncbi:MAG TPA: hypothetical protein VGD12_06330 [Blastococcus sp.]
MSGAPEFRAAPSVSRTRARRAEPTTCGRRSTLLTAAKSASIPPPTYAALGVSDADVTVLAATSIEAAFIGAASFEAAFIDDDDRAGRLAEVVARGRSDAPCWRRNGAPTRDAF